MPNSTYSTWYVVADGGHARILARPSRHEPIGPVSQLDAPHRHAKTHELGSDRPGHVQESIGGARHAVEPPDYHAQEAARFADALSRVIAEACRDDRCQRLVLVAPTRFLAMLRAALPTEIDRMVDATLAKDLTPLPAAELTERLEALDGRAGIRAEA